MKLDFSKKKCVYFIGIGGISMSALALILLDSGFTVLGSDTQASSIIDDMKRRGIKINTKQIAENITKSIDLVVYSKAIKNDNEELVKAKELNIEIISRSELLSQIMQNYKHVINIAGTHGKTTTTSFVSKILLDNNFDPTINVGANVKDIGGNLHIGKNKNIFVAEACEYTNSFLDFRPTTEIITNIEEDHLDYFKDLNDIRLSFKKYIDLLNDGDTLIINSCIDNIDELVIDFKNKNNTKLITYGSDKSADFHYNIEEIRYDNNHYQIFNVYHKNENLGEFKIKLIGKHNVDNAVAAIAFAVSFGIDVKNIKEDIFNFNGADRRLENKGEFNGFTLIDDYAHHPSEIKASIMALKELNFNKIYLIFQPHTYSRTKALFNDFVNALSNVDNLILTDIYAAREIDDGSISSKQLSDVINENFSNKSKYIANFEDIVEYVCENVNQNDLVVVMGAGDIYKVCSGIREYFKNKNNMNK